MISFGKMTDQMRVAFGYDDMGNASPLLCLRDWEEMARGVPRAAGDAICPVCHVLLRNHPPVQGALWATRTCTGIVKL